MSFEAGFVEFRIEVAGDVQIQRRLEGMLRRVDDWSPAFERIANHFQAHMAEVFATEGGATAHGKWTPLSPAYAKTKPAGKKILERDDLLRQAMTGGAGSIRSVSPHELQIGGTRRSANGRWDVGLIHQKGTDDGRVPMRPIIDLPEEQKRLYMQEIRVHLWAEQ